MSEVLVQAGRPLVKPAQPIAQSPFIHLAIILFSAAFFNLIPWLTTGIPLHYQLSTDAEGFANICQTILNPQVFMLDETLPRVLPRGEFLLLRLVTAVGAFLQLDVHRWSIVLSFLTLLLFLVGVYAVVAFTVRNKFCAFLVAGFSVLPVKMLGAGKYGFQALGFVPQNFALAVATFLMLVYFLGVRKNSPTVLNSFFFVTALCANFYPQLFFQMTLVFLIAEWFRVHRFEAHHVSYVLSVLIGSFPVLAEVAAHFGLARAVNPEIFRERYHYMMIFPLSWRSLYYLRTFAGFVAADSFLYSLVPRSRNFGKAQEIEPWITIAKSAFWISLFGLLIENFTPFTIFFFSRASVWFALSSMVIIAYGALSVFGRGLTRWRRVMIVCAVSLFFIGQSHLLPLGIKFWYAYQEKEERVSFLQAARELKEISQLEDVILAPTGPREDLAQSLRTYSLRPVYVTYKDIGVALHDEERGRFVWERYQKVRRLFHHRNAEALVDFMKAEKIRFALIPSGYFSKEVDALEDRIVYQSEFYVIIRS